MAANAGFSPPPRVRARGPALLHSAFGGMIRMRLIVAILWMQLVLGAVGLWASFGYVHWAATGSEWWMYFERDFEKLQRSPEYREPPAINGLTYARVIEAHRSDARVRLEMAGYGLVFSLVVAAAAVLLLWRVHRLASMFRLQRQIAEPGAPPNGGPATPSGNSGVTEGPPSVS